MQLVALALAALATAGAAPPSPPDQPLGAFPDYGHPEIGAASCQVKDPAHTECFIPAKTAGRYLIEAAGTSTATGPDATQTLVVGGPGWTCNQPVSTKKGEWTGGQRTLQVACVVTVLADTALPVVAIYADTDAKMDPKGPVLTIRRVPWNGVLAVTNFQVGVSGPPKPPAK
ncbi:MAG: hypothetical protein P4L73_19830 [Caulobacteraceae bacterium]|nr:hypothetical protein [Caulobacteraceae bacterium]